jgi:ADP-heptose:LPS heptosyltransferase
MKKILIISSNRLGDSILSSGLNEYFKKKFDNCQLTFVCGEVPSNLFKYCENIDKLIVLRKMKFSLHWLFLWKKLVLHNWFYVVDLRGTGISFFLSCKKRFRYKKNFNYRKVHKVVETTKRVVGHIANPSIKISSKISLNDKHLRNIIKLKRKKTLIMIAPTANWIGKIWPSKRFFDLINNLKGHKNFKKSTFILVGPLSEKKLVKDILNRKRTYIYDLFGNSSLIDIFQIMKFCNLFIGNDSGLMHLASLANIPTIGLFGPSDKIKYAPWGKKNLVINSPKNPDELMGFVGFDSKKCGSLMLDLDIKDVFNAVIKYFRKIND